jgi:HlyD family secretion protein
MMKDISVFRGNRFVSGHGFSRAVRSLMKSWALAPDKARFAGAKAPLLSGRFGTTTSRALTRPGATCEKRSKRLGTVIPQRGIDELPHSGILVPQRGVVVRSLLMSLIVGLLALTTTSCSKNEKEAEPVVAVQTAVAERGTIAQSVIADAVLFPKDQAAITPKITAPVKTFYVQRGSKVHRGELLAVLENRDLAAAEAESKGAYEQAQGNYDIQTSSSLPEEWQKAEYDLKAAKQAYDAQQKIYDSRKVLYEQGALPRKDFDQSSVALIQAKETYEIARRHMAALEAAGEKNQMKIAKGQLTAAQGKYEGAAAQLAYSEIRSPINGVVAERPLYAGETAAAGTPLLVVMDTSSVIVRAHIPQAETTALQLGDDATITAPGGAPVSGKVTLISPALDASSTTDEVWVAAPNPSGSLRVGTTVTMQIVARTVNDAIVIPASALLKTPEGATTVMVAGADGKAHQVSVETGIRQGDRVQVTKGLAGGEKVITSGAYGLPDNTKVKIVEAAPPAEVKKD